MAGRKNLIHQLEEFKHNLGKTMTVQKILLFGSYAEGTQKAESDVDLIIVSEEFKDYTFIERTAKMYGFWSLDKPVDFLCYTPKEFEDLGKKITIVRQAIKRGITL